MSWANRLTLFRMVLVPVFITAVLYHKLGYALCIFIVATLTDALDGYVARRRGEKTRLGAMIDPIADKMLVGSAFICFSLVEGLPPYLKMPAYVPIIVISRDVIILTGIAVIYLLAEDVEIKPTMIGKITTSLQMATIIALLVRFVYSNILWNLTVLSTVISGLDYLRIGSNKINGKD